MTDRNGCGVAGCIKPHKRGGYCYGHYMKNWRYGTPTPQWGTKWIDIRGQRFGTLIVKDRVGHRWLCRCDCGRTRFASAGDLNRYSDSATCGHKPSHHRSETAGYSAAHDRVRRDRGPIRSHSCVDCDRPAAHWSYNHDDPDGLVGTHGVEAGLPYSLRSEHYSPRCVSCHKYFDLGRSDVIVFAGQLAMFAV